ncbi:hypothetical protein PYCC9005_003103 [Savitreella phatthalungensis]
MSNLPPQVTRTNPLLPIGVLVGLAASFQQLGQHVLFGNKVIAKLEQACVNPKYIGKYIPLEWGDYGRAVNKVCCIAPKFFQPALESSVQTPFLSEFVPLFGLLAVIVHIAANRSSAGFLVRWSPTFFLLLAQFLGAGFAAPVALSLVVFYGSRSARASFIPSGIARSLLPALTLGYLIPSVIVLAKGLVDDAVLDWGIILWQPFPLYMAIIIIFLSNFFHSPARNTSDAMVSTTFIVSTTDAVVLVSFLMHLRAIYLAYTNGLDLASYLPNLKTTDIPANVHTFLFFDFLSTIGSLWTLVIYDTTRFANLGTFSVSKCLAILLLGTVVIGPAGATAWAWSQIEKARLQALVADRPKTIDRVTPAIKN